MFRRPKRPSHSIDMAPLIDVVFLLLVFFMLTSSFTPPALPLTLPKSAVANDPPRPAPVVSIDADGLLALDGEVLAGDQFEAALRDRLAGEDNKAVNFRGDRGVDYGLILDIMNRARGAGASQINLVYESAPTP
jgi:biopolymer transport protein ExbD